VPWTSSESAAPSRARSFCIASRFSGFSTSLIVAVLPRASASAPLAHSFWDVIENVYAKTRVPWSAPTNVLSPFGVSVTRWAGSNSNMSVRVTLAYVCVMRCGAGAERRRKMSEALS